MFNTTFCNITFVVVSIIGGENTRIQRKSPILLQVTGKLYHKVVFSTSLHRWKSTGDRHWLYTISTDEWFTVIQHPNVGGPSYLASFFTEWVSHRHVTYSFWWCSCSIKKCLNSFLCSKMYNIITVNYTRSIIPAIFPLSLTCL